MFEELYNFHLAVLITYGKAIETEEADEDSNLFGHICQPTSLDSSNTTRELRKS
jgi:hypothetical protein